MSASIYSAAFLMGLAGGVHCLAMCSASSLVITAQSRYVGEYPPAGNFKGIPIQSAGGHMGTSALNNIGFHAGRLSGYGVLGSAVALAMEKLNWFSDRTSILHTIWMLLHLGMLAWGLVMLFQARQPQWLEFAGKKIWALLVSHRQWAGFSFAAGCLWALWPCGLLYSALMVSALSGRAGQGAAAMVLFGLGSGLWLLAGQILLAKLQQLGRSQQGVGLRMAGAMLVGLSAWAIWQNAVEGSTRWCR